MTSMVAKGGWEAPKYNHLETNIFNLVIRNHERSQLTRMDQPHM